MMFEIKTEASFSAAHHLLNYNGNCENIHGHNWLVRAAVTCATLNKIGIGIDFRVLKGTLKAILDDLDHKDLNTVFPADVNPSSENIARYIFTELKQRLTAAHEQCRVARVEVFETPGNSAVYFE